LILSSQKVYPQPTQVLLDGYPELFDGIQLGVALGQHACEMTETRDELFKRRLLRLEVRLKKELHSKSGYSRRSCLKQQRPTAGASLTLHPCGGLPPGHSHCWVISVNRSSTGLIETLQWAIGSDSE
jgi:hypothetical protein